MRVHVHQYTGVFPLKRVFHINQNYCGDTILAKSSFIEHRPFQISTNNYKSWRLSKMCFFLKNFISCEYVILNFFLKFRNFKIQLLQLKNITTWNMCEIFWEKLRNQSNLDKAEKLWYLFAYFLSPSAKNLFLQGRLGTMLCPQAVLGFS